MVTSPPAGDATPRWEWEWDGWQRGPDGMLVRHAARVILLDAAGRVLLGRGHDGDQPERSWWFTIGGGIAPGESDLDAALREVREETGLTLDPTALRGPVLTRSAIFDFYREHCRQHEVFYLARVAAGDGLSRDGWTDLERALLDDLRWFSPAELRAVDIEVFPVDLPELVETFAAGWDGVIRHIGDVVEL